MKQGIKCEVVINRKQVSVAEGILAEARRGKAGIIAMVSQSGPVESWLLGERHTSSLAQLGLSRMDIALGPRKLEKERAVGA